VFAKLKGIRIGVLLDMGAMGFLIGQSIGRWGNFVNAEAYGSATDSFLRMQITNVDTLVSMTVHPTFLYESLWNAVGFLLLHFYFKKRKFNGEIFLYYVAWYGFGRGIIAGLRSDSLYLLGTNLRVSQVLGFLSFIVAVGILIYKYLFVEKENRIVGQPYYETKRMKKKAAALAAAEAVAAESEAAAASCSCEESCSCDSEASCKEEAVSEETAEKTDDSAE